MEISRSTKTAGVIREIQEQAVKLALNDRQKNIEAYRRALETAEKKEREAQRSRRVYSLD